MAAFKRIDLKDSKFVEEANDLPIPRGTGFVRLRFGSQSQHKKFDLLRTGIKNSDKPRIKLSYKDKAIKLVKEVRAADPENVEKFLQLDVFTNPIF
jgi:predicted solute-binding protein